MKETSKSPCFELFSFMWWCFLFSNACIKHGSLCIFLCWGSLFSQGELLLSTSRTCVFVCAVCKCLLSSPIEGLGVVKGMWGDKCQVFDSPQASNPGGRTLGRHRAPLLFLMWPRVWSQYFHKHWARNSREEEMWSRWWHEGKAGWCVSMRTFILACWMWAQADWFVTCISLFKDHIMTETCTVDRFLFIFFCLGIFIKHTVYDINLPMW